MSESVSVVAGGWSVSQVDLAEIPGTIIAVNDAALYLPRVDIVLTMDRKWTQNRWEWLEGKRLPFYTRSKNLLPQQKIKLWVNGYECDETRARFSETEGVLHGPNSGHVALNLAYQRRPKSVFLFGFDMCYGPKQERHWYPDYPWRENGKGQASPNRLRDWARDMENAALSFQAAGINVYNVTTRSKITVWQKVNPLEVQAKSRGNGGLLQ